MPAKFNVLVAVAIPLVPLIPLLACGGDSKTPDAHLVVHDSPNGSGSGSGSGSATCAVAASLGSPTFTMSGAFWTAGSAADATNVLDWEGVLPGTPSQQILDVQIYGGCGSGTGSACGGYPTPDWPAAFMPKSNLDLAMAADAGLAVLADISGNKANTVYIATAGTLNITTASNGSGAGHTFAGTASNVTFKHYDFPSGGMPMPDADGCTSTLTSLTFTGTAMFEGKFEITPDASIRNYLSHRTQ